MLKRVAEEVGRRVRAIPKGRTSFLLGPWGLPGDFLIAPSGQIKALKYGTHAFDQWSVDELIPLAKGAGVQAA